MKSSASDSPHPDLRWQGPEAWLDPLELLLLRADPQAGVDTAGVRHGLELVAAYAAGQGARTAGLLAGRLLGLVGQLGSGALRPTSTVLDTMQRGIDVLRQVATAGPGAAVEADAAGLLAEIQALSGSGPAAASSPVAAGESAAPSTAGGMPAPTTPTHPDPGSAQTFPWTGLDALLGRLGTLVDAQSRLAQALRPHAATLAPPAAQALAQVDAALRPLAAASGALRAAHRAHLPSAPELLEVTCLRAGTHHGLVPTTLVVDCAPAGTLPPPADAIDLGLWLASPATPPRLDTHVPALRLTLEAKDHRVCWLVDEVLFQRTVVLHRLETNFRAWPGVTGAAVLGNLGVCLVLDPATLRPRPADAPDDAAVPPPG